jgi:DNA-binding transcriptional LysR family regulator
MILEPRRILTFREVARRGSFSHAATALSLTQPAVSQQVRALEVQVGTELIKRGPGGLSLTPAGELLLHHAEALADRLELAERQLTERLSAEQGRLRVGVFPSALATMVPTAIAELQSRLDRFELAIAEGSADEVAAGVREGELHTGLCFQNAADPRREHEDTVRHDLVDESMLAAVGTGHRLAGRRRIRLSELAHEPWIAATPTGLIVRACREAGFEPRLDYLTGDPLAIRALVAEGLAVTLVSPGLAQHLPGVKALQVIGPTGRRTIYALSPTGGEHPLVPALLNALRRAAKG